VSLWDGALGELLAKALLCGFCQPNAFLELQILGVQMVESIGNLDGDEARYDGEN
jgi:hypothetical protein